MRKKLGFIAMFFAAVLLCGCTQNTETPSNGGTGGGYNGTLPELIEAIYEKEPVELSVGEPMEVDLTDANAAQYSLGLSDVSKVSEAYTSESMIGAQAYSLAAVRVKDAADAAEVAQAMFDGIDQAKWICVTADALTVTACDDIVLLVMADTELSATWHTDLRDAFLSVMGGKASVSLERIDSDAVPKSGLAIG